MAAITAFPIATVLPAANLVASTPSGPVTATNVQTAINQLAGLASSPSSLAPYLVVNTDSLGSVGFLVGGDGSGREGYGLWHQVSTGDAIDNNGAGTAKIFPPNLQLGQGRNSGLDTNACLHITRTIEGYGGTPPYKFNTNEFGLFVKGFWPQTSAGVSSTGAIVTSGGTSAGNHAAQNPALIAGYGFGDSALEVDGYGGMIHTLLVRTAPGIGAGSAIYPKYALRVIPDPAGDSIPLRVDTPSEFTLDSTGSLSLGPGGTINISGTAPLQTAVDVSTNWNQSLFAINNNAFGAEVVFAKTRGAGNPNAHVIVHDNDEIMGLYGYASDGTLYRAAGRIRLYVDGTPGVGDMPARWQIETSPDGSASPVERVRVDSFGFTQLRSGALGRAAPVTKTGDFSVGDAENWLIVNKGSSCIVTLPAAPNNWTGREIMIKTIQAQTVVSASSNVVPLVGGSAGTAILAATAGKWATLVFDGTSWVIMAGN